jgi:hypothetical protein
VVLPGPDGTSDHLAASGPPEAKIYRLYPDVEPPAIDDALDLERQVEQNLRPALAA